MREHFAGSGGHKASGSSQPQECMGGEGPLCIYSAEVLARYSFPELSTPTKAHNKLTLEGRVLEVRGNYSGSILFLKKLCFY